METAPSDTNNGLLFANFNQDFGCFVCVTGRGFRIFNADPLREKEARHFPPGKQEDTFSEEDISSLGAAAEMTVTADATLEAVGKGLAKIVKVRTSYIVGLGENFNTSYIYSMCTLYVKKYNISFFYM